MHFMDVLEFVREVRPDGIKVNYLHGKMHDVSVLITKVVHAADLDKVVVIAEGLASMWPFCMYQITKTSEGCYSISVEYKVKKEEMLKFCKLFSLQAKGLVL